MKIEFLDRCLKSRQQTNGKSNPARGLKNIDPAANAVNCPGEIVGSSLQKHRPLGISDQLPRDRGQLWPRDRLAESSQCPTHAQCRGQSRLQMQIAGSLVSGYGNKWIETHVIGWSM